MLYQAALILGALAGIPFWMFLVLDARTWPRRIFSIVGLVFVSTAMLSSLWLAFIPVNGQRVMYLDHKDCQSYQWLDEDWKCVPWEEAG